MCQCLCGIKKAEIQELFGKHLADITSDIEKKYNLSPADAMKRAYSEMKRYVGFKEKSNE